jgi:hypothetical protein
MDVPDLPTMLGVQRVLVDGHIPSWIERTTRGYHLWVFPFDGLVDAVTMRGALHAACVQSGYEPKEIFPKQTRAMDGMLGNYVRLPLNGAFANPPAVDARRFIHPGVTLEDMDRERAVSANLVALAETVPLPSPQPVGISVDIQAGLDVQREMETIGGKAHRLWRDGPPYGLDRSMALVKLARYLAKAQIEPSATMTILLSADQRWGKFTERGESGIGPLQKIVGKVYGDSAGDVPPLRRKEVDQGQGAV